MTVDEFLKNGGTINQQAYKGPRTSEKTWSMKTGSAGHIGAKAVTLQKTGINKHPRG